MHTGSYMRKWVNSEGGGVHREVVERIHIFPTGPAVPAAVKKDRIRSRETERRAWGL